MTTQHASKIAASIPAEGRLQVGERLLDIGAHRFLDEGPSERLTPKAVALLLVLAGAPGRTFSQTELLDRVWAGTCPTQDVVRQAVRELRRAFDDDIQAPRYIETIAKAGYRLVAPVEFLPLAGVAPAEPPPHAPAAPTRKRGRRSLGLVVGLAGLAALLALLRLLPGPSATQAPSVAPVLPLEPEVTMLTSEQAVDGFPRLSPDGARIAFTSSHEAGGFQVYVSGPGGARRMLLSDPGQGQAGYPAWSSDGAWIAYFHWDEDSCSVIVVPSLGGAERRYEVCRPGDPSSLDWYPDEVALLLSLRESEDSCARRLYRLDVLSGDLRPVGEADPHNTLDEAPRFSPDGRWIAVRRGTARNADLWLQPRDGGTPRRLTQLQTFMRGHTWLPDGSGLVLGSSHTGRMALYLLSLQPAAKPVPIGLHDAIAPELHASGLLYFQRSREQVGLVALIDALDGGSATPRQRHASTGNEYNPVYSPDGRYLAFLSTRSGREQIWIEDRQAQEVFQLTHLTSGDVKVPTWDASSRRLLLPVRDGEHSLLLEADVRQRTMRMILRHAAFIESAAYTDGDRRWVALGEGGHLRLHRLDGTGEKAHLRELGYPASRLRVDPGNGGLYFQHPGSGELFRLRAAEGTARRIELPFRPWQWHPDGDRIHALEREPGGRVVQWEIDAGSGHARRGAIQRIGGAYAPAYLHADRDPVDGEWLATAALVTRDDIAVVRLPDGLTGTPPPAPAQTAYDTARR